MHISDSSVEYLRGIKKSGISIFISAVVQAKLEGEK